MDVYVRRVVLLMLRGGQGTQLGMYGSGEDSTRLKQIIH